MGLSHHSPKGYKYLKEGEFLSADGYICGCAEKLLLVLRDGRKLIGVLRSWDQFGAPVHFEEGLTPTANILLTANLVLQDTIERIFVRDLYADIPRGIFLVRGENVLLLGEIVCTLGTLSFPNLPNLGLFTGS